jgi:glycosyltransferase involved in cell wall biosynthesis
MADEQQISVIVTVKNEAASILDFLESLAIQTCRPSEVVIVDGGSIDGTQDLIRSFPRLTVRLLEETCNIARGRNIGIMHAQYDAIAVTDAGCSLAPDWLSKITGDLAHADVVVGNYRAQVKSLFDACQYSCSNLFGSDTCLERFTISSRSLAFRKTVWEEIGGYPEWLDYSEDAYFHDQIRSGGYRIVFRPDAIVEWMQRQDLRKIFLQYFRYMGGEALGVRHTWRNMLRFATYILGSLALYAAYRHTLVLLFLFTGFVAYVLAPVWNFCRLGTYRLSAMTLIVIPAMLIYIDCAKMAGYSSGVFELLRDRLSKRAILGVEVSGERSKTGL